jgi:hypothetical protein
VRRRREREERERPHAYTKKREREREKEREHTHTKRERERERERTHHTHTQYVTHTQRERERTHTHTQNNHTHTHTHKEREREHTHTHTYKTITHPCDSETKKHSQRFREISNSKMFSLGDRVTYLASKLKGEEWAKREFGESNWRTARLKGSVVNVLQSKLKIKFDHVSEKAGKRRRALSLYFR